MSDIRIDRAFLPEVAAVIGGGFGSEGKGLIVSRIFHQYQHHVRVGAANAGHTGYFPAGDEKRLKVLSQQLPMAAWMANEFNLFCYIGPGAVISKDILLREIAESRIEPRRLFIDQRAHVITEKQIEDEANSDLKERIGSTSTTAREGIGTATADRVMRSAECSLVHSLENRELHPYVADVPARLSAARSILLEGTQGSGLSLTTGFFPYTTSRNTTAAGLLADSGVAPMRLQRCIGVFRTFPIRVAGNSGPFYPDSECTSFEDIGVSPEFTTVTKLRRRIATWSDLQLREAVRINGFSELAITFMDYVSPNIAGVDASLAEDDMAADPKYDEVIEFLDNVYAELPNGVDVTYLGTGPDSVIHLD